MTHCSRSHAFTGILRLIILISLFGPACAQTVRDDFKGAAVSEWTWLKCERPENRFDIVQPVGQPFRALRAVVRTREALAAVALLRHAGCTNSSAAYVAGRDERAEVWEADRLVQPFGTEVWYRFSMFIDPAIRKSSKRFVIGQWKQSGIFSPFVAQRFDGHSFKITIQQDNDALGRDPAHVECRVWVAADANSTKSVGDSEGHPSSAPAVNLLAGPWVRLDVDEGVPSPKAKPCKLDLTIEQLGELPIPFNRWTEMLVHIRASADQNGLLEVWADRRPITRVTGRIGSRAPGPSSQYFKFGPYRNPEPYDAYALIANYRRGPTRDSVE
jgi:hypothetical protein